MKKFRVAKCIDDFTGRVREFAIFEDGSKRKQIYADNNGHKYFDVDNELNKDSRNLLATLFSDRIKDAVDTVIDGNGDIIKVASNPICNNYILVSYFLDREYGESLRQKTIEGFKDTKFGYIIKYGPKVSFYDYCNIVGTNYQSVVYPNNNYKLLYFDSYPAAREEIQKIIDKAYEYAKQINDSIPDSNTDKALVIEISNKVYNQMIADLGSKDNIIIDFAFDMLTGDGTFRYPDDHKKLFEYGYKIAQYPYPKEQQEVENNDQN